MTSKGFLGPRMRAFQAVATLWLACAGAIASAAPHAPPDLCRSAAVSASRDTGVPLKVLLAISLTETGRRIEGTLSPWPWTLNIAGKGHWLDGPQEALTLAKSTRAGGQNSFDVGCFQINYRWHGEAFASLDEMMDPQANALYAAQFLAGLYAESGSWSDAAGAYHSRTPLYADRYRKIFDRHFAGLDDIGPIPTVALAAVVPRENRYPLLQAGDRKSTLGSLVPTQSSGAGSLFTNRTATPFWSGS